MIERSAAGNFVDTSTHRQYSRIVGGLAWPTQARGGFLVAVGEDSMIDDALGERPLRVLAEARVDDLDELARVYGEFSANWKCAPWYGNPDAKFFMHEMREKIKGFALIPAPHYNDPENAYHYAQLIKTLGRIGARVLNIGGAKHIRNYFNNTASKDLKGSADDTPILAALGYAVSQLHYFKAKKVRSVSDEMSNMNFSERWG